MSALGEYIHLNTMGYKAFGISRDSTEDKFKYKRINNYLENRTKNLKTISQNTLEIFKSRIAGNSEIQEQRNNNEKQKWQQIIDWTYDNLVNFTSTELLKDFQDLTSTNKVFQPSSNVNKGIVDTTSIISDFMSIRKNIRRIINKINEKQTITQGQIDRINILYQELEALVKNNRMKIQLPNLPSFINNNQEMIPLYNQFQNVLDAIHLINKDTTLRGDFGEYLSFCARDEIWNTAIENVNSTIKQSIVGGDKSPIFIPVESIKGDLSKRGFVRDGDVYSIAPTQNKIDVQITVNNQDLFISAKGTQNAQKSNGQKLQTEMSLLYTLSYLNDRVLQDFGNHWLNMHAANNVRYISKADKANADLVLKQELAYEALVSGNPWKQNNQYVNVFATVDIHNGKVYVLNTKDMLTKLFDFFKFDPSNITSIRLRNRKEDTPEKRIYNILNDLHQQKITVHYQTEKALNALNT